MIEISPAQLATETALALLQACRRAEAMQWFRRAIALDPGAMNAVAGMVRLLLESGDLKGAVELLQTADAHTAYDLRMVALRREVALRLYGQGLWEDAAKWLAEAAELEPWDSTLAAAAKRTRRPDYLAATITDPLSGRALERYAAREGESYIFVIEIVGTCNLRCPTCPVGNSALGDRPTGIMSPELFEKIVAKIKRESPADHPIINLYNWGEPLLHPKLPSFIKLLKREGLRSQLSTNLNIKRGLEEVLAADPDELKISLSGFHDTTYRRAHARGDIELVKENMRLVSFYRTKHGSKTRIWVGHHIYKSNRHEIEEVRLLCHELGFEHHPIEAFYMPLERLIESLRGTNNPRDSGIIEDLLTPPADRQRRIRSSRTGRYDCELRFNQTVINHDGSVALCCTVYDQANMLGVNYLDESLAEIEARKYRHGFCSTCYAEGLQYAPGELALAGPPRGAASDS